MFWILIYATKGITAVACGTEDAHSSGAPDLTPSLLDFCDIRFTIDLILYLWQTYFVIMSIDSGLECEFV